MTSQRTHLLTTLLAVAGLLGAGAALAAEGDADKPQVAAKPRVSSLTPTQVRVNDQVTVTVSELPALITAAGGCQEIVLYLDERALAGNPPEWCDPDGGRLRFALAKNEQDDAVWHALLGRPNNFRRQVGASVGAKNGYPLPSAAKLELEIMPKTGFYVFALVALGVAVGLVLLAKRTNLLRDAQAAPPAGGRRPYSLARFQMAFWFVLVVAAYLFLWLILDELDTITESILALIGIGSGTALGAALVDNGKRDEAEQQRPQLAAERQAVETEVTQLQGQIQMAGAAVQASLTGQLLAKQTELKTLRDREQRAAGAVKQASSGRFLKDILTDGAGMSLHRVQMFVWTLVLGIIFVASAYRELAMPEFSATLLGLMGISSGAYLGFKFPERHPPGS